MTEESPVPPIPPVPPVVPLAPGASPYSPSAPAPAAPTPYSAPTPSPAPSPYAAPNPYAAPSPSAASSAPGGRRRKSWDVVLTIVLLALGFFGMLTGLILAAALPFAIEDAGGIVDGALVAGDQAVIVISHLLLFLLALGVSIPLLVTRRIAFWVPLTAGIVAAIVFWATFASAVIASGV